MNLLTLRNKILIAAFFGMYQMLINIFFASYDFLELKSNFFIYLSVLFILFAGFEFLVIQVSLKTDQKKGINKLIFSGSFLFVGLLASSALWIVFSSNRSHYFVFILSFFIASFLPTLVFLLYFIYKEAEEKFTKYGSVSLKNSEESDLQEDKVFHLENVNGKLLLEVPIKKIICFEANDNYVVTYYLKNEDELAKSMERISLKKIEEMLFAEDVVFFRVHKSYLINNSYFEEVKGRAQAYKIKLKHFPNLIPVSRSYDIRNLNK